MPSAEVEIVRQAQFAGHSDLEMTGEYTFVEPERQNELTRRIQQKLGEVSRRTEQPRVEPVAPGSGGRSPHPSLADTELATRVVQ